MRPIGLEEWRRLFVRTVPYFGDSGATAQYVYLQPGIVLCPTTHHVRPVELADLARRIAEHFGAPPALCPDHKPVQRSERVHRHPVVFG